jgi:GT2 family glycosyltransferase
MELIYAYGTESDKDMKKLMDEEFFKRLGPTVRECKHMGLEKEGFCMYIKRACLRDVGVFDTEVFRRGYGEENDFCLRAARRGSLVHVGDANQ